MDDIELFAKNEKELETLIHAVRIYSQDIGMEFGIEKCAMLVMKSGKRYMTDGMELPNHDKIRTLEENETSKYLGILEADTIKQLEMKDTIQKESLRRTRKLLETKLFGRNLIKGSNTLAVPLVRYSGPFLKWTRDELKQMDQRTRKLMSMHKALHPRDDVDRLYVSRKQGGRGLGSIEDTVDASIQRLEDYIEKHERGLITTIRNDLDNTIDERMTTTVKQKWEGKQLYGRFKRQINNISHQKSWTWLRKGNLKCETESLLITAQDNAIRTNHIKARIDIMLQNSKCTVTWYPTETIEIRLILSSRWNEQWQPVKKVTVKKECRSQRGYQQMLVLSNLRSPDTGRRGREKPNDWLGPQNGSGDSFPSAEIEKEKISCLAGFVAGRRTKASIPGRRQKNIWDTRDPSSSSHY